MAGLIWYTSGRNHTAQLPMVRLTEKVDDRNYEGESKTQRTHEESFMMPYFLAVGFQELYLTSCRACPYNPIVALTIRYKG